MSWLDDLYDKGVGIFDKVADYKSSQYELETLRDMAFVGNANASADTQDSPLTTSIGGGFKIEYIAFGVLAVVALLMLKK